MSGTYDDAIRSAIDEAADKKKSAPPQPTPSSERERSPGDKFYQLFDDRDPYDLSSGSRVPLDRMKDYKYYVEEAPYTGDEKMLPPQRSVQREEDIIRRADMDRLLEKSSGMVLQQPMDVKEVQRLQAEYEKLRALSPSWQQGLRSIEAGKNVPLDADVMIKAIENRQRLGRNEQ